MKKLLAWTMALALCFSLAACHTTPPDTPEDSSVGEVTTTSATTVATTTTVTQTTTGSTVAPTEGQPSVTVGTTATTRKPQVSDTPIDGAAAYKAALNKLKNGTLLAVEVTITDDYGYYDDTAKDTRTFSTLVLGYGTDNCRSRTKGSEGGWEYVEYYADGKVYRESYIGTYSSSISQEWYGMALWDVELTPSLYKQVKGVQKADGTKVISLSGGQTYEDWIYGVQVDISDPFTDVSAVVTLGKDGAVTKVTYTVDKSYGAYRDVMTVQAEFSRPTENTAIQIPGKATPVDDVQGIAYELVGKANDVMPKLGTLKIYSQERYSCEYQYLLNGKQYYGGTYDAQMSTEYSDNGKRFEAVSDSVEYLQREGEVYGGQLVYEYSDTKGLVIKDTDGKVQDRLNVTAQQARSLFKRSLKAVYVLDRKNVEVYDLGTAWLVTFDYDDGEKQEGMEMLKNLLYDGGDLLGQKITTVRYSGMLVIEKETFRYLAQYENYEGTIFDSYGNKTYPISFSREISLVYPDAATDTLKADEKPAKPEKSATPLLYRVTGKNGQEMYLLGTIHAGDARSHYLPDALYKAFDEADAVAFETDFKVAENAPDYITTLQGLLLYQDGTTLKDHLSKNAYTMFQNYIMRMGYFEESDIGPYSLAYWEQMVQEYLTSYCDGIRQKDGVDYLLLDRAYEQGKQVYAIEDWKDHLVIASMFDDDINEMRLLSLLSATPEEYEKDLQYNYELWCAGKEADLAAINDMDATAGMTAEEKKLYKAYEDKLITQRDAAMVKAAKGYLESGETVFMAVGHAHVIGKDGIAAQLKAAGYTVEIVQYP